MLIRRTLLKNLFSLLKDCSIVITILHLRGEITTSWCASAVAMFIVIVITIAGNLAVITAIRRAAPRFPAHYPLASLAMADLMLGAFVLPISAARELFLFQPYRSICATWATMDVFCCTASILSLCTLGWERWCGITNPLARARRHRRARLFAALVWPVAAAVALPTAFIPTHVHYHPTELVKACTVNTNIGYVFFSVSFSFYLPASGMMFLYTKILMALATTPKLRAHRGRSPARDVGKTLNRNCVTRCHPTEPPITLEISETPLPSRGKINKKDTATLENNNNTYLSPQGFHLNIPVTENVAPAIPSPLKGANSPGGIIPRQRRATQTIVILMSVFLVCWWPFFVMLPIDSVCECVSDTCWLVCTWLGYVNSALDPLVYAAASPTVRRALQSTLTFSSSRTSDLTVSMPVRRRLNL